MLFERYSEAKKNSNLKTELALLMNNQISAMEW